jgi:hypothetical protein
MRLSNENCKDVKHSSISTTPNGAKTVQKTPCLTLQGTSNDYIYCLRKIFRKFIETEHAFPMPNYALHDLNEEIAAARLLFAEDRLKLHELLTQKTKQS